jgi:integrase
MVAAGLRRSVVNRRVGRIKRVFRWGVSKELVPVAVSQALDTLEGLAKGRTAAPESEPVRPVPEAFVEAVRPHVTRHVWGLIELQRYTGCRPGEACGARACDMDMTAAVWLWQPAATRGAGRGRTASSPSARAARPSSGRS